MDYDLDLHPARVTLTYLRRDGTTGRTSSEVWARDLRDARRLSLAAHMLDGGRVTARAEWIG